MNVLDFFLLQMNDEDSRTSAKSLEMNFRCLKGENGFDEAIARINKNWPTRLKHEWVAPLFEAIRPYYKQEDGDSEYYTNPLNEFLEQTIKKLNGHRIFLITKNFSLDNFTKEELSQPHMQWVTLFSNRYNALVESGAGKIAFRLSRIHPCDNIGDELAITLAEMFENDGWATGMDFNQFVNWYVTSRANFKTENQSLNEEIEARMTKTLHVWHEGKGQTLDNHLSWLSRNYEFHPLHDAFLKKFIAETLDISVQ